MVTKNYLASKDWLMMTQLVIGSVIIIPRLSQRIFSFSLEMINFRDLMIQNNIIWKTLML